MSADSINAVTAREPVPVALLRMAFSRLRLSVAMTVGSCAIYLVMLWPYFPPRQMTIWSAVMAATAAARYALWWAYSRDPDRAVHHQRWQRLYTIGAVAAGASWALGAVLLMPGAGRIESILIVMALLTVSAVAMAAMAEQLPAMRGFVTAALVPTIFALATNGGEVERVAGAVMCMALLSLLIVGQVSSASTRALLETERRVSLAIDGTNAARDRAEAASLAKTRFLANMSHELRTPLNAVIGAAQLMKAGEHDAEQQEHLVDAIQRSGTNLLGLIENILDMSRIEAGEMTLNRQDFHLVECVEAALSTAGLAARAKGLQLACIVDPSLTAWRHGDAARLRQALMNLLGNAVKFTLRGEIVVRVERGASAEDVRISVSDTGIGISAAALPKVFEPFHQADEGADRRFAGSGLGLAIVRQLVETMGGQVSVRSALGVGSRFELALTLPQAVDTVSEPAPLGHRIAYFEPHEAGADALHTLLVRMGCEAQRCRSASELRAWCTEDQQAADRSWLLVSTDAAQAGDLLEQVADVLDPERVIGMSSVEAYDAELARDQCRLPRNVIKPVSRAALASRVVSRELHGDLPQLELMTDRQLQALTHVLVVEDDPLNQTIVCRLLRHAGFLVSAVSDGQSAIDALRSQAFDLVLMDWQMPEMDGLEATRRLRAGAAGDAGRRIPIVALTANAFAEDRDACLTAGMNDYLTKPVLAGSLMLVIDRWVRRAARPVAEPSLALRPPLASLTELAGKSGSTARSRPAQPDFAESTIFDPAALDTLPMVADGSQPDYAGEVLDMFVGSVPATLATIRQHMASADLKTLQRVVHTLKSSSATVGALAMVALAERTESNLRVGIAPPPDLADQLRVEFNRLQTAVGRHRAVAPAREGNAA